MSINVPTSIKSCPLNVFKLFIRPQISAKKMNRKQCWNMWILEYLLNFSPQVIYHRILRRLNKAIFAKILVDHRVIKTKSGAEVWCPATLKEELSAPRKTLINKSWCNIPLCLMVVPSWWVTFQYKRRSNCELRSSNGSFKYGRTTKWRLHCTSAVSKWLALKFGK